MNWIRLRELVNAEIRKTIDPKGIKNAYVPRINSITVETQRDDSGLDIVIRRDMNGDPVVTID